MSIKLENDHVISKALAETNYHFELTIGYDCFGITFYSSENSKLEVIGRGYYRDFNNLTEDLIRERVHAMNVEAQDYTV